ncbi:MAG TPA: pitrilysin family protein [Candidatus Angelobacter sp.]|jgi:predicted Zn-dependent peptidase|nr:pitrilysin family protein [Candidatus Angelobacter sp.]
MLNIFKPKFEEVKQFSLDNGLKIIILENHQFPIVYVNLLFDRVLFSEGNKSGWKSIFGPMLRSGTKNRTKEEIDQNIEFLGTKFYASFDEMSISSLTRYLDESLSIMRDVLFNPIFNNTKEFEKIIGQKIVYLKINEKNPHTIAKRVKRVLYFGKNHPFGEIQTIESLNNIKIKDFDGFYRSYIEPNVAYLILIGDIDIEKAKKISEKYFYSFTFSPTFDKKYETPPLLSKTTIGLVDIPSVNQSTILVGNKVDFRKNTFDYLSAVLVNSILGGGGQSRLFLNLREDKGYTYNVYSSLIPNKHISSFYVYTQVRSEVTAEAVKEIIKEFNKITSITVTSEELQNYKKEKIGSFLLGLEDLSVRAKFTLDELRYELPFGLHKNYLKSLQEITSLDVKNAANKYIPTENFWILIVGDVNKILPEVGQLGYPIFLLDELGNSI